MKRASLLLALLLLAGCSRGEQQGPGGAVLGANPTTPPSFADAASNSESVGAPAPEPSLRAPPASGGDGGDVRGGVAQGAPATGGPAQAQGAGMAPSTPMLAYTYAYQLQAQADRARTLMHRHQQACAAAGPTLCQVVSANEQKNDDDQFSASLELRAAPVWLDRFRAGLDRDAADAGGRVLSANVQSEDLTRAIVDSDAALRARTTLRTRLESLLATHRGSLSDLLEVERELARVQGEIDATQSELAVMRTRVATSRVTLNYASRPIIANPGAFRPLNQALNDSAEMFSGSLAVMIRIVVLLAPWVAVVGLILWLLRRRLPKFGRRKVTTAPPLNLPADPPAPPPAA